MKLHSRVTVCTSEHRPKRWSAMCLWAVKQQKPSKAVNVLDLKVTTTNLVEHLFHVKCLMSLSKLLLSGLESAVTQPVNM